jgi:hypothetical protein
MHSSSPPFVLHVLAIYQIILVIQLTFFPHRKSWFSLVNLRRRKYGKVVDSLQFEYIRCLYNYRKFVIYHHCAQYVTNLIHVPLDFSSAMLINPVFCSGAQQSPCCLPLPSWLRVFLDVTVGNMVLGQESSSQKLCAVAAYTLAPPLGPYWNIAISNLHTMAISDLILTYILLKVKFFITIFFI